METHRIRNDKVNMPQPHAPSRKTLKIIMDSNVLFVPLQFKIDVFDGLRTLLGRNFEPILLSSIQREIRKLAEEGPPKMRKNASYALKLAEKCRLLETNDANAVPDDAIVEAAMKLSCPVFTNDALLRKKLRNINVPVIYVRQKSRLEIEGRL